MASERIINEYDSTRIANAVDTLATNLADYSGTTVTPTDAMKAKLPSQTTADRIADAVDALAQNVTDLGKSADDISYDNTTSDLPATEVQTAIDVIDAEVDDIVNVYGSKNLLKNELYKYGLPLTVHDVTFNQLDDDSISMSGTASASTSIALTPYGWYAPYTGSYIFSGGDSTDLYLTIKDPNNVTVARAYGDEVTATLTAGVKYMIWLSVTNGTVTTGRHFYPMLRLSSITDDTYAPYAKTNLELTKTSATQSELSNLVLTGTTNTSGATIASGTCFVLNGDFVTAKTDIVSGATFTLNTNYEKKSVGEAYGTASRLVASSTAGGTFKAQLTELKSAFNSLSAFDRMRSYIKRSNGTVYRCTNIIGIHSYIETINNGIYIGSAYVDSLLFYQTNYLNGTWTINDVTNSTLSDNLELWVV